MKDIAFHLTDIAENSLRAGADRITVGLALDGARLEMRIADNGCGLSPEMLQRVADPFCTTRTTRRVGLGLPFLFQNARQSGGGAEIRSQQGVGTTVTAWFMTDNIDCPPAGELASTLTQLLCGNPGVEIEVELRRGEESFHIATQELRDAFGDLPLGHPKIAALVGELLGTNFSELFADALP